MSDIKNVLRGYILENLLPGEDPANLTDDMELKESGILDSMSTLKLVTFLEGQYQIEFEAADLEPANLSSISTLERLVRSKL